SPIIALIGSNAAVIFDVIGHDLFLHHDPNVLTGSEGFSPAELRHCAFAIRILKSFFSTVQVVLDSILE
ncbi:hypothetical protein, partial [Escherichia coli]|uniref:hypothetical protein n=2 Tax=Enterobacterales TaxID=91347 RepID=UPI001952F327